MCQKQLKYSQSMYDSLGKTYLKLCKIGIIRKYHRKLISHVLFMAFAAVHADNSENEIGPKYVISPKLANNVFLAVLLFVISLALLITIAPILVLFAILRIFANLILRLKHGKNYGGLVDKEAHMWKIPDITNPLINIFTVQQSKISSPEAFLNHLRQCLQGQIFESNAQKLTSVCKSFLGYPYYLMNQLTIDDICNKVTVDNGKEFLDENELTDILGDLSSKPMPKDNSGLFEVLVVQKPLKQIDPDIYDYAVIIRVDHIVSDGINLTNFFLKNFADDQEGLKRSLKGLIAKFDTSGTKKAKKATWQNVTQIAKNINTFMVNFPTVFVNQMSLADYNCMHGPQLSGKKYAVYAVENQGENLMEAIKQIKRRVTGSTFTTVLLTAISRAMGRHMQKQQSENPNFLSVAIMALLSVPDVERTPVLVNSFSIAVLDLPLLKRSEGAYCQITLVEKYWKIAKEKPDFLINYMMFNVFGLIPIPILTKLLKADKVTLTISNLPGVPKLNIFGGQQLEKIIFFGPHRGTVGIGFSLITYDNKLQMGLLIDKALICSKEEAQSLVNDVLKEICRMCEELRLCQPGLSK
nr:unnamed protein product [Callosobruchus analis]